jgi:hypothetical protein
VLDSTMGADSKHNVIKVEERLPCPNEWVIAITADYRCMAYIDGNGTWRDFNRNAVVEGVQAWCASNDEGTAPPGAISESTKINFVNRNGQRVIGVTQLPGNDSRQRVYILQCRDCLNEYAANGSEVWEKSCPACQDGGGLGAGSRD